MVIDKVHTITDKVSQELVQIRAMANTAFFFEILVSQLGGKLFPLLNKGIAGDMSWEKCHS